MILAQIVAGTTFLQCLERLQWLFLEQERECQTVRTLFSIADRGNITSAYQTYILSILLFTMSFFFLCTVRLGGWEKTTFISIRNGCNFLWLCNEFTTICGGNVQ